MNNKGQTLVVFIILIPIIFGICAFVFDVGLIAYQNDKVKKVTETIFESKDLSKENIVKLYKKNNINIDNLVIKDNENRMIIENDYFIDSMFGIILGIKKYEVRLYAIYNFETNELIFK